MTLAAPAGGPAPGRPSRTGTAYTLPLSRKGRTGGYDRSSVDCHIRVSCSPLRPHHPEEQPGQAQTAVIGGRDRRSAQGADAPLDQSRDALLTGLLQAWDMPAEPCSSMPWTKSRGDSNPKPVALLGPWWECWRVGYRQSEAYQIAIRPQDDG